MTWRDGCSLVLVTALSLASAACGDDSTSPTSPTQSVTESFSGTLAPLGTNTHLFTVTTTGSVSVVLNTVSPLATLALGVSIGSWDGSNCIVLAANTNARASNTAVLSGTAVASNFCLQVYDSGNLSADVTYAIDVTHP